MEARIKVPLLSKTKVDKLDLFLMWLTCRIPTKSNTSEYLEEQRKIVDKEAEIAFRNNMVNRSVIVAKESTL